MTDTDTPDLSDDFIAASQVVEAGVWDHPGSTVEDMEITPELAAEWLGLARSVEGPNLRRIVARYSELMATGRWENRTVADGAMPVLFDQAGKVRYGLMRLEAVVRSGATITATVVRWPLHDGSAGAEEEYELEVRRRIAEGEWFRDELAIPLAGQMVAEQRRREARAERNRRLIDDYLRRVGRRRLTSDDGRVTAEPTPRRRPPSPSRRRGNGPPS